MATLHYPPRHFPPLRQRQQGVVLIVCLILMFVLTLIGVTAMQTTGLEERMAGNVRDYNLAFQSAEAALRRAESILNDEVPDFETPYYFDATFASNTDLLTEPPLWEMSNDELDALDNVNTRAWGVYESENPNVAREPEFIIEFAGRGKTQGVDVSKPPPPADMYRVSARGYGGNSNTVVVLQSIFKKDQ